MRPLFLYLQLRMSTKQILAFVGDPIRSPLYVEASSTEKPLMRQIVSSPCSLRAAEVVGTALASRLKDNGIGEVKFRIEDELESKQLRYHERIRVLTEALERNGIRLVDDSYIFPKNKRRR